MKTLLALMLAATSANADSLQQADLANLRDPALRDAEVARLVDVGKNNSSLKGYHFLTAKQKNGAEPLYLLCASISHDSTVNLSIPGRYKLEKPEELFGALANTVATVLEPTLDPVRSARIFIFNSEGKEIRPFGGNNYTNTGYYFDFDHEGTLDRADSTSYSVSTVTQDYADVFKLQSIEPEPRTLLEVVFNWNAKLALRTNQWTFICFDDDDDGTVEIGFGPQSPNLSPKQCPFIFRWDPTTKTYLTGAIPADAHIRVIKPGETLESIAKAGGLTYPPPKETSPPQADLPLAQPNQAPYVFHSFKDHPGDELAAFFQGKPKHQSWEAPEDSFPNRLPDDFWNLPSKEAALALADANRTPTHRAKWKLAVDDRNLIAPPKSGWLVYDWHSSTCFFPTARLFTLRFGVPNPSLTVFESSYIGMLGSNPDFHLTGVRDIKLSVQEARFLAETVFWLDHVRTFSPEKANVYDLFSLPSSTADGHATISLYPDGSAPSELATGSIWAASTISNGWKGEYVRNVFVNLAHLLVADRFPTNIHGRWDTSQELGHQSSLPSSKDPSAPQTMVDLRKKLTDSFAALLQHHAEDPMPAAALATLVRAAGTEALVDLTPALQKLSAGLADAKLVDPLPADPIDSNTQPKVSPSNQLRSAFSDTLSKLRLAGNITELKKAAAGGANAEWALAQLRGRDLDAWSEVIAGQFKNADTESRRRIMETLTAANPTAAKQLIDSLAPAVLKENIIEVTSLNRQYDLGSIEQDIPVLMSLVEDKNQDLIRRMQTMDLLSSMKLPPEALTKFTNILVAEIKDPQQSQPGITTLDAAISALTKLPNASEHVDLLISVPGIAQSAFRSGLIALLQMAKDHPKRQKLLADFIRPRFTKSIGMMNDIFFAALANDVRELAPDIAAFASENASVQDGDGANYSGGNFKSPVGQRYHLAREITALWSEKDPVTLGQMWIYFVAAHPTQFSSQDYHKTVRELASRHIRQIPVEQRRGAIKSALALVKNPESTAPTQDWLSELGQKD